jgi:hypothetical protein
MLDEISGERVAGVVGVAAGVAGVAAGVVAGVLAAIGVTIFSWPK